LLELMGKVCILIAMNFSVVDVRIISGSFQVVKLIKKCIEFGSNAVNYHYTALFGITIFIIPSGIIEARYVLFKCIQALIDITMWKNIYWNS